MDFVDLASTEEIPEGTMKKFEINDTEILIANKNGKFYALSDRCGHMNVSLAAGKFVNGNVQCPMHKAQYSLETGEKVKDPHIPGLLNATGMGKLMSQVKVHNQKTYETKIEKNRILVRI
jgi:3-phenylpropionate/trans-cinnamate dioxygenase ferredoxin subunit